MNSQITIDVDVALSLDIHLHVDHSFHLLIFSSKCDSGVGTVLGQKHKWMWLMNARAAT
jgi:hypothetical protein